MSRPFRIHSNVSIWAQGKLLFHEFWGARGPRDGAGSNRGGPGGAITREAQGPGSNHGKKTKKNKNGKQGGPGGSQTLSAGVVSCGWLAGRLSGVYEKTDFANMLFYFSKTTISVETFGGRRLSIRDRGPPKNMVRGGISKF